MLEGCKNLTLGSTVTLRSAMTFATLPQLDALAEELLYGGKSQEETAKKGWVCGLCGYVYDNDGTCDAHLPMGQGNIDWNRTFASMRQLPDSCVFIMEYQT